MRIEHWLYLIKCKFSGINSKYKVLKLLLIGFISIAFVWILIIFFLIRGNLTLSSVNSWIHFNYNYNLISVELVEIV